MFSLPFSLSRSVIIEKPIDEVFKVVNDFNTWRSWSPWLCQEPECEVKIKGNPGDLGHSQEWNGNRIGVGTMSINSISKNYSIHYDLHFLKPWKSHSKVSFFFSEKSKGTEVNWSMQGSVPIFMFFLRKLMSGWVGRDYERGLTMLKDLLETGEVISNVDIKGTQPKPKFYFIGKERTSNLKEIGVAMEEDFTSLHGMLEKGDIPKPDFVMSIYKKINMVSGDCNYISGFGYGDKPDHKDNKGIVTGDVPEHTALQVDHIGPYKHLGNGWSTIMTCQRAEKKKQSKIVHPYEVYKSDPHKVPEKEVVTEIFLPLK